MAFGDLQGGTGSRAMAEINMVPLIDIVLVLLVLFILAAPMATQSVDIRLPQTAGAATAEAVPAINVYLLADGRILDEAGQVFELQALRALRSERVTDESLPGIRVWSDQDVRYELLANLIVDVRNLGFGQISLMTRH